MSFATFPVVLPMLALGGDSPFRTLGHENHTQYVRFDRIPWMHPISGAHNFHQKLSVPMYHKKTRLSRSK